MHRGESARVQRGFALIALLSLAALFAAFLIASALNFTSAGNTNEREDRSMSALRKAKAALIAYAASEQWQAYKFQTTNQPGGLPCPDNNDTGVSPGICPAAADRVGRLPWATIGSEDLRDASGERLWYAVSSNFYKNAANIINSDTPGLLTVTGAAPASNVVAVVIAPGEALSGQDHIAQHNNPAAYLEGVTASTPDYVFSSVAIPSGTANDRLLVITQADLMAAVEPVVAARIERDVKPLLQDYFGKWGAYPFAAPFVAPPAGQSAYQGASNQTMGLLPLTADLTWLTWASATATSIVGSGTGYYDGTTNTISPNPTTCSISSPPPPQTVTCTVNYCCSGAGGWDDRPDIKLEILLANASMSFAGPSMVAPDDSNIVMVDRGGIPLDGTPYGQWSAIGSPPNPPTRSFVARADGSGAVTYTGRLQNARDTNAKVTITVPLPAPYLPRLTNISPTNPNITWFTSNQWYRQTYYAISSGLAPGGVGSCNPPVPTSPACLTVNNLPGTTNNKQAIVVFFGRALDGQIRPGTLANYLEGENSTPADLIFEHRAGTATTINDRVVVVSPP